MAQIADVILPSPAFTEQNGLFMNLEGRLQKSVKSSYATGEAKEDWRIFNLLSKKLNSDYLLNSFNDLRENTIKNIINYSGFDTLPITKIDKSNFDPKSYFEENISIKEIDYYFTNSIARSSKTMSDCRSARSENLTSKTGT